MDLTEDEKQVLETWRTFRDLVDKGAVPHLAHLELYRDRSGSIEGWQRDGDDVVRTEFANVFEGSVWVNTPDMRSVTRYHKPVQKLSSGT